MSTSGEKTVIKRGFHCKDHGWPGRDRVESICLETALMHNDGNGSKMANNTQASSEQDDAIKDFDLLSTIRANISTYSESDRKIALKLLERPADFIGKNIKTIARIASVSEPTIIRFCRRIGYEGLKDFKIQAAKSVAVRQAMREAVGLPLPDLKNVGTAPIALHTHICMEVAAVVQAFHAIDQALQFELAADAVISANRVYVISHDPHSKLLSEHLTRMFLQLSIATLSIDESYIHRNFANSFDKGDVVIFLSPPKQEADSAWLTLKKCSALTIGVMDKTLFKNGDFGVLLDTGPSASGDDAELVSTRPYVQLLAIDCMTLYIQRALRA